MQMMRMSSCKCGSVLVGKRPYQFYPRSDGISRRNVSLELRGGKNSNETSGSQAVLPASSIHLHSLQISLMFNRKKGHV